MLCKISSCIFYIIVLKKECIRIYVYIGFLRLHRIFVFFQEVKVGDELQGSGENVFVGGKNRWK